MTTRVGPTPKASQAGESGTRDPARRRARVLVQIGGDAGDDGEASSEDDDFFARAWHAVARSTNALTDALGGGNAGDAERERAMLAYLETTLKSPSENFVGVDGVFSVAALRAGLTDEQRVERAAMFVRDAKAHRYTHGLGAYFMSRSKQKFWLIKLRDSVWYSRAIYTTIVLFCIVGAMALPPERRPDGRDPVRWAPRTQIVLNALNLIAASVLFLDCVFRSYVWGIRIRFLIRDSVQLVPIALMSLLLADAAVGVHRNGRGWPIVRAARAFLLFRSQILKRTMVTLLATVPAAALIGVFIFTLILLYSILAIQFYGDGLYTGPDTFDEIGGALRTIFLLLFGENYPAVALPAATRHGYFAWLFFMSFLVAGTIVSLNVVLSLMVPLFRDSQEKRELEDRVLERKALTAAFGLVEDTRGTVTFARFSSMVRYIEPHATAERVQLLFARADQDGSGSVNIIEFFGIVTTLADPVAFAALLPTQTQMCIPEWFQSSARRVVQNKYVRRAIAVALVLNTIVYCLYGTVRDTNTLNVIALVILGLFSTEVMLKVVAAPRLYWRDAWSVFDFVAVIVLGLGSQILLAAVRGNVGASAEDVARRFARGAGAIRLFRLLDMVPPFRALTHTMVRIVLALGRFVVIFLIVFFVYAIIGQDLFAYKIALPWTNLDTVWNGTLLLFQVVILAGWSDPMYALMAATNKYTSWYFILYVILATGVVFNAFVATLVDSFGDAFDVSRVRFGRDQLRSMVTGLVKVESDDGSGDESDGDGSARSGTQLKAVAGGEPRSVDASASQSAQAPARPGTERALLREASLCERARQQLCDAGFASTAFLAPPNTVPASSRGTTPLHVAAAAGDMASIARVLGEPAERRACLNTPDSDGNTPLFCAIRHWQLHAARALLRCRDVKLETVNEMGMTPLLAATAAGFERAVRMLICRGANVSAQTSIGGKRMGVVELANATGHRSIARLAAVVTEAVRLASVRAGNDGALSEADVCDSRDDEWPLVTDESTETP